MEEPESEEEVRPLGRRVLGTVEHRPAGRHSDESLDETTSCAQSDETTLRAGAPATESAAMSTQGSALASWQVIGSVPLNPEAVPMRMAVCTKRAAEEYPGATAKAPMVNRSLHSAQAIAGQGAPKQGAGPVPPAAADTVGTGRGRTPLPTPPKKKDRALSGRSGSRSQSEPEIADVSASAAGPSGGSSSRKSTPAPPEGRRAKAPRTTGYDTPKLTSWSVPKESQKEIPNYP